jgi:hypothetical protein
MVVMSSHSEMSERIQRFCQSLQYVDSRRLESVELRRLSALQAELEARAKVGKWQLPLMILLIIVIAVALRLIGVLVAGLIFGTWYSKLRTAREFMKMIEEGSLEPVVDRYVAVDSSSIEGLFVNDKPRARKHFRSTSFFLPEQ